MIRGDRLRQLLLLEIALAFAFLWAELGAFLVLAVLVKYQGALEAERIDDVPIVVASRSIPLGRPIDLEDIAIVNFRPGFVPPQALIEPDQVLGRVAKERILPGEFIREERLAVPDAGAGITAVLSEGTRAVMLDLGSAARVASQVQPGDRVDVIASLYRTGRQPVATQTVLQGIPVLAVDQRLDRTKVRSQREVNRITFAMSPEDAQRLAHATRSGKIKLSLRSPIDFQVENDMATTTASMIEASGTNPAVVEQ